MKTGTEAHDRFDAIRQQFELHPEAVYLNTAGEGPLPRVAREALLAALEIKSHPHHMGDRELFQVPLRTRELCSRIAGCSPEEIALTHSTGAGINLAAQALPLSAGDEILILEDDFPALRNPFLHARNRKIVPVEVSARRGHPALSDFDQIRTSRTRALVLSHVHPGTGYRHDLAAYGEFCRQHRLWFVVDAAQSAGVIPLHLHESGIHILSAPGHKWMMGLSGTGFVAIQAELMERLSPPAVGWLGAMSHAAQLISPPPFDIGRFKGGRKFEVGTTPFVQLAAWNASLELILGLGVEKIWGRVDALLGPVREYLKNSAFKLISPEEPSCRSGILAYTGRYVAKQYKLLRQRKIFPGLRRGAIRLSPYLHNSDHDMKKLIEALGEVAGAKLEADRKGENL